jgi:hypothetical protein
MEPHVDSLFLQFAIYEKLGETEICDLIKFNYCFCLVMLTEINNILNKYQYHPYPSLLQDCKFKCSEIINKITRATEYIALLDELAFMTSLFQVNMSFCFVWKM